MKYIIYLLYYQYIKVSSIVRDSCMSLSFILSHTHLIPQSVKLYNSITSLYNHIINTFHLNISIQKLKFKFLSENSLLSIAELVS